MHSNNTVILSGVERSGTESKDPVNQPAFSLHATRCSRPLRGRNGGRIGCAVLLFLLFGFLHLSASAQNQAPDEIASLQRKVKELESRIWNSERKQEERASQTERKISDLRSDAVGGGLVLFFFAVFCALWAQNTGRSAWLWFFLGLFLHIITALVLLTKNSNDNFERRHFGGSRRIS